MPCPPCQHASSILLPLPLHHLTPPRTHAGAAPPPPPPPRTHDRAEQVKETTRDVCFLHNETFFAAAQKKYVYIYDKRGIEVRAGFRVWVKP